jgi:GNAT superfamily N-acetyltransferase
VSTDTRFVSRPLSIDQLREWTDLYGAVLVADADDDIMDSDDLAEEFEYPLRDFARGSIAVYDGATMVGYCVLQPRNTADPVHEMRQFGGVRPEYRGLGIGGQMLAWTERAALELHGDRFGGRSLSLGGNCLDTNASARALFTEHGYLPARWFHQMTCDLSHDLDEPAISDGVQITGLTPDRYADALLVRNEAFRDHWAPDDKTPESWAFELSGRAFRPKFSFIADLNGEPMGLVLAHEYEAYNEAKGARDLYIPQVCTRRAGRKRGIASALLGTALRAAKADGFTTSTLDVDADSPTGAVGLYARLGFVTQATRIVHRKMISPVCSPGTATAPTSLGYSGS